jgi:GntR family transcriptional repressor for pyruvate dehydrogenase complex
MDDPYRTIPRQPNLSDQVTEKLQELIATGQLRPAERLPSERELAERFGVSRTVIREAVRSLVAKGLLEVKSGSGMVISVPQASSVAETMGLLLRLSTDKAPYEYIFEVRQVLEVEIAGLAAQRATPEDIQELRSLIEFQAQHLDDLEKSAEADVEFHAALANATQNVLFSILLDSIAEIMLEVRLMGLALPDVREKVLEQHSRIFAQVKAGNAIEARKAMVEHLRAGKEYMQTAIQLEASNSAA